MAEEAREELVDGLRGAQLRRLTSTVQEIEFRRDRDPGPFSLVAFLPAFPYGKKTRDDDREHRLTYPEGCPRMVFQAGTRMLDANMVSPFLAFCHRAPVSSYS